MLDRVLVPLDGSPAAERALGHLLALAPVFDAGVLLLRVVRPGRTGGISRDAVEWRLDRGDARRYLSELAGRLTGRGLEVEIRVREGRPAEEIVRSARDGQVDLVLMSAVGHGADEEFPLGGTVHKVLSATRTSVLLARRGPAGSGPLRPAVYPRVLLLSDCSRGTDLAARVAACVARAREAPLELVHVVPVPELPDPLRADDRARRLRDRVVEESRRAARSYLEEVRRTACGEDVEARIRVTVSDDVVSDLHRVCREDEEGLTVVCSRASGRAGPGPHGGIVTSLLQHGCGPILVLQEPAGVPAGRDPRRASGLRTPPVAAPGRPPSGKNLHFEDRPR